MPVSLSFLFALLLRILAGQEPFHYDPELGHGALTWFFVLISGFLLLHLLAGTARVRARDRADREPSWLLPLRSILPLLPLILYGLVLFPGGWLFWIEVNIDPRLHLTRELMALLPYLWFEVLSLLGAIRLHGNPRPSWLRLRKVLAALPIWAAVWIVQDLLPHQPTARAMLDELPLARPLSMLLTILLLLPLAPIWVRWLYNVGPLPNPEYKAVLLALVRRVGIKITGLKELHEESEHPGPLFLRGLFAQTLVPDREFSDYRSTELEVLFVSGLQRIKRHMDLRLLLLALLLPLCFFSLFDLGAFSGIGPKLGLVVSSAFLFLLIGMLAWFRRRYVLEADLATADELGQDVCEESMKSLVARGEDPGPRLFEPGLAERRDLLVAAREDKGLSRAFHRANRYSELVLLVLVLCGFGITAPSWQDRWDEAMPSYLLSLGMVSQAEQSLEPQLEQYRARRRAYETKIAEQMQKAEKNGIELALAPSWDEPRFAGPEYLRDLISRARLLIHDEADEGNLPLLRSRALGRARLALIRGHHAAKSGEKVTGLDGKAERNASFEQALRWFDLVRRWGTDRSPIEALQLGLISRLIEDPRGLRRSKYLLHRLDIPSSLDRSVRIILGS